MTSGWDGCEHPRACACGGGTPALRCFGHVATGEKWLAEKKAPFPYEYT